ncbi:biotin-dependent carboxyltransferase family protein [Rhodococcus sp. BP-252]|uniref:5-oxoprolinase subunit C family protein n=1 Tax=unclassified Rhodococcus (in: high G+C Gram-positive bacteria) TaxID=192944 RepID=UPI001C9A4F80|nr:MULTISPECIES: biotin-dependent carboxyltransferase family protein [unclassified Rhodococcus (in: high G+C Gram-positive bacteria)]MBY6413221.1 biotin-dependent carboxyltransferase family protein [Rhodococcus sp. BP-320]MBY6418700.1 biotin-dependent carboxyltransferase family protein [Rhodococcus sp. BP-321]MBY6422994.1 biotin-dependent carboxyltransferase family protein [Rhodococcus sp. BP-324]MBY6427964.1 biotin-dependent carboxyltransferase family protein [Rhodococcus sp. BP-323]MBY643314
MTAIEILEPGPLCTIQDRGRVGYSSIGVGRSGAADIRAHDAANRLVGNAVDAATLEVTMGGFRARVHGHASIAVTGAEGPITVNGTPDALYTTLDLADGDELAVGTPTFGLRTYIAIRGGFDVEPVLGSRSTDTMSGLGPSPLESGDVVAVGCDVSGWPAIDFAPPPERAKAVASVILGPRADWFTELAVNLLYQQHWSVTSDSNRVGIRLDGDRPLERAIAGELPSEGMVPGALQVPPDGKPVLFLADHPVTGGYPVIGVVASEDLPVLGQLRPGDSLRFRPRPWAPAAPVRG